MAAMKTDLGNTSAKASSVNGAPQDGINDAEFFAKYGSVDFSAESVNRERNLERLKAILAEEREQSKTREKGEGNYMNKKYGKRIAVALAAAAVMGMSAAAYGADLIRIIETVLVGNSRTIIVEDGSMKPRPEPGTVALPESVAGTVFDRAGNALEYFPADGEIFTAGKEPASIVWEEESGSFMAVKREDAEREPEYVTFGDLGEGLSYFKCDILIPSYLPDGYTFDYVHYYTDSMEHLKSDPESGKYVSVIYSNGTDEIWSQMRYIDETTGLENVAESADVQKLDINGNKAVITGDMIELAIGDVLYIFGNADSLDTNELVKIAESLK